MYVALSNKFLNKFFCWLNQETESLKRFPLSRLSYIQNKLQAADVLLIEGRTRVSQIIKLITRSSWSHAALYLGRGRDVQPIPLRDRIEKTYSVCLDDQLILESLLGRGTIVSPLHKYEQEHMRICRPHGITCADAQQVIAYTLQRLGVEYDFRQILDLARFLLPWPILPRTWRSTLFELKPGTTLKETCSSLIAEAFQSVDFPILPVIDHNHRPDLALLKRNPRLYVPKDFDYSPFFDIIKYPILDATHGGVYHDLPWDDSLLSNDDVPPVAQQQSDKKK